MTTEIRRLAEDDAEAFWSLRLRGLREHPDAFGRSFEETTQRSMDDLSEEFRLRNLSAESGVWGAFNPALVGVVGCVRDTTSKARHKAAIWGVYVAPEVRGQGIGKRLMTEVLGVARRWPGVEQIMLTVAAHNVTACALYRSLGFESYGLERHALKLPDRYVDEAHLVLFLQAVPIAGDGKPATSRHL